MKYLYIGLLRNSELGLIEVEQENTNYRRVELGPGDWFFLDEDKKDIITNAVKVEFPESTNRWGIITHFGIFDSLYKGVLLTIGTLNNMKNIEDSFYDIRFEAGSINIPIEIFDKLQV